MREKCQECNRTKLHWEGCSHVVCPQRKVITAAPAGEAFVSFSGKGAYDAGHGYIKQPTSKE